MGAVVSLVKRIKRWFINPPNEYNSTNEDIKNHHNMNSGKNTTTPTSGVDSTGTTPKSSVSSLPSHNSLSSSPGPGRSSPHSRSLSLTLSQPPQVQKDLQQTKFYLENGPIQPEVWPTISEFQLAKDRIQYDPEKLHFAVCGGSGSGKSSLINALRGLKNNSRHAAPTAVVETTKSITRYSDPHKELPYNRLVWFDCPGAGTLKIPGWQYFNQQGLFIFDIIVLVYNTRFTEIDVSIIQNCERFKIPLFIVRSKADMHIRNIMNDLEDDDDEDDDFDDYQAQARQSLIDTTRNNLNTNLEEAGLGNRDVFIVSSRIIYSLVTGKASKKTTQDPPPIDEARFMETVLETAYARRYGNQTPAIKNDSTTVAIVEDNTLTNSYALALT